MVAVPAVKIVAPWYPNVLAEVQFPIHDGKSLEPVVKELPIRYGKFQQVGEVRKMARVDDGNLVLADTNFRVSHISTSADPVEVISQDTVKAKAGSVWAGLGAVNGGAVSATSRGTLSFHPSPSASSSSNGEVEASSSTASLPSPLTCLATSSSSSTNLALAGKEVDVSIWDIERVFSSPSASRSTSSTANGKRKKNELEPGEIWRAKNIPNDKLNLRPPIHHLSLTYLRGSTNDLVSGTKSGSVRRFDTRQRKPVWDKKVAKDGGIACVESGHAPHELFFSDGSSLFGALDLRTGGLLYTFPSNSTIVSMQSIPLPPSLPAAGANENENGNRNGESGGERERIPGLASISADGTLRTYLTSSPPDTAVQNAHFAPRGKKGNVLGMFGGVGRGTFIVSGWGEVDVEIPTTAASASRGKSRRGGQEDGDEDNNDGDGEDGEEDGEDADVWEEMDEVDEDSDDDGAKSKSKRRK